MIHLHDEIQCPYYTRSVECFFKVDFEATWRPPISPQDVSIWGTRLAKACVGPDRGSGGTLDIDLMGLRGPYTLKFEIGRRVGGGQDLDVQGSIGSLNVTSEEDVNVSAA